MNFVLNVYLEKKSHVIDQKVAYIYLDVIKCIHGHVTLRPTCESQNVDANVN